LKIGVQPNVCRQLLSLALMSVCCGALTPPSTIAAALMRTCTMALRRLAMRLWYRANARSVQLDVTTVGRSWPFAEITGTRFRDLAKIAVPPTPAER